MQSTKSSGPNKCFIIVFCLILVGVGTAVALCVRAPLFETNDDVMLKAIASGDITGTPDAHLVYIMYPLGLLLKALYSLFPDVACYDLLMIVLRVVTFTVIVMQAGMSGRSTGRGILFSMLAATSLVAADINYLWVGQYTPLAGLMAGAAIFIIASSDRVKGLRYWIERGAVIALLIVSINLRKQAMLLSMPILVLAVAYKTIVNIQRNPEDRKKCIVNIGIWIGILAAVAFVCLAADKLAYSSPKWKEFFDYNGSRTDIYDYYQVASYDEHSDVYERMGIHKEDMYPLAEYDLELFDGAMHSQIDELSALSKTSWESQRRGIWVAKSVCRELYEYAIGRRGPILGAVLSVMFVALFVWGGQNRSKKLSLLVFALFAYQEAVGAYFLYRQRFPDRVSHCLFLCVFLCMAGCVLSKDVWDKIEAKKTFAGGLVACLCLFLTVASFMSVRDALARYKEAELKCEEWETLNAYISSDSEAIYLLKTNSFSAYGERMFTVNTLEGNNSLRLGTWICGSPLYDERLKSFDTDSVAELISSGREIYWVQDSDVPVLPMEEFFKERYNGAALIYNDTVKMSDNKSASIYRISAD